MKRFASIRIRKCLSLVTILLLLAIVSSAAADIVEPNMQTPDETPASSPVVLPIQNIGQQSGLPMFAVPEPATFGIFSLALAIGSGLLIRNKRSDG